MLPKVNQMLYYQIASSDEADQALEFRSRIADEEEGCLLIENPLCLKSGNVKRLYLGDELSIWYMSVDGVKHYFDSYVIGFKEDGVSLIIIAKPDRTSITKAQRRSFLRVSAELELAVRMSAYERFVCHTDDIGGGGISFTCKEKRELQIGGLLDCWLLAPYKNGSIEHVPFQAEIVRVNILESGHKKVMIKFIRISDTERGKIIRYCFEKQLAHRNR